MSFLQTVEILDEFVIRFISPLHDKMALNHAGQHTTSLDSW